MSTLSQPTLPTPLLVTEGRAKTAKAGLRKSEIDPDHALLGGAMRDVQHAFGLTLQEFAHALGKNESQVRRQMDGLERPQIEAVFAIERYRGPLVIALARLTADVDVVTEIRVRKSA